MNSSDCVGSFGMSATLLSFLFMIFILFWPIRTQAQNTYPDYYEQHAIGWHWYKDPPPEKKTSSTQPESDPVIRVKAIRQRLERALDQALLNPTPAQVTHYITLQNAWSDQASKFSRAWQWALLQHPQLNYSITHPTNQIGRTVYLDNLTSAQSKAITQLAKQQGLFYFYRSSCGYCQRFAPIVKAFSEHTHMPIIAISTDGNVLPEFPDSRLDHGQAARFQVSVVPALFTVNPYTQKVVPISYGLISESDLRQRILEVAQITQGEKADER